MLMVLMLVAWCSAEAQSSGQGQSAEVWAGYYAHVYQVPVELVEAVIEVESDWCPSACREKGRWG